MRMRTALILLLIVAFAVTAVVYVSSGPPGPVHLVPSWSLLPKASFRAMAVTDPFVSWSPDSRSVLLGLQDLSSFSYKIFKWDLDTKKLAYITSGVSPNFVTINEFIYLKRDTSKRALGIFRRDLRTGSEQEIASGLKKNELFPDVTGFAYDPTSKTITICMTEYTRFRTPGPERYDLRGNLVESVSSRQGEDIIDYSYAPDKTKCAILVRERYTRPVRLQIAKGSDSRGREIAQGHINAVAWSPNGDTIAYAQDKIVVALRPSDFKRVVVARFGDPDDQKDKRYVSRLIWSPNSRYLAVFVYVPDDHGDYPLYYVLDMSKCKWES
jgi:WD40 repeat protein